MLGSVVICLMVVLGFSTVGGGAWLFFKVIRRYDSCCYWRKRNEDCTAQVQDFPDSSGSLAMFAAFRRASSSLGSSRSSIIAAVIG
jgi:hypothetical protein